MRRTVKLAILCALCCLWLTSVLSMKHIQMDACLFNVVSLRIKVIAEIKPTPLPQWPGPFAPPHMIFIRPPVMDPPHHGRRRKKRLSQYPATPNYHKILPESGPCDKERKYRAVVTSALNTRFFNLPEGTVITVIGSKLLNPEADLFVTVSPDGQCEGWRVFSARIWNGLTQYQTQRLTDHTYFKNCDQLEQCFGNLNPQHFECFDKFSYCSSEKNSPTLKKDGKGFGSCVKELKDNDSTSG